MTTNQQNQKTELIGKINNHTARVGVIGMGYVGLPFAVEKAKVGFKVTGIEENPERAARINAGDNYIADVDDTELKELVRKGLLKAETGFKSVPDLDVLVICVPTPLDYHLAPDLQHVEKVTRVLAEHLRPGQLISLESTTYPGTTEEVILPILKESGLREEVDFYLCHSPERVDPGNKRYSTKNTNKVVGGLGPHSQEVALAFYGQTIELLVPVSSPRAAELVKVFENTFRSVNIALVNEMALLCDKMNLNVWEVLDAAFTKPFGIIPFYPGPGVGGHCIPIDPHYLEWKARQFNFTTHFIGLAGEVNRRMPEFVREKTLRLLNEKGIAPSRSKILMLGMAYKKDLGDYRDSPALSLAELLLNDGVELTYNDPYIEKVTISGHELISQALTEDLLKQADLVLIVTDHSSYDYNFIVTKAKKILDTRNATATVTTGREKITLL